MTADLSQENHTRLIWCLLVALYFIVGVRYWALRRIKYKLLSPRGISSCCILLTVALTTLLCSLTTWSLVGPYRDVVKNTNKIFENSIGNTSLSSMVGSSAASNASTGESATKATPVVMASGSGSPTLPSGATLVSALPSGATLVSALPSGFSFPSGFPTNGSSTGGFTVTQISKRDDEEEGLGEEDEDEELVARSPGTITELPSSTSSTADNNAAFMAKLNATGQAGDLAAALQANGFNTTSPNSISMGAAIYPPETASHFEKIFKVNFAAMVIFYLIIWLVKASFIIIYFEFDWDLGEGTRKFLYITAGTIMVTFAFVELTHMLWCLPLDQNWDFDILMQPQSCRSSLAPSAINSVINVMTDLLVMTAGIAIIRSLNVGRNDFRAASLIIGIACLTIITALIRMSCLLALMVKENDKASAAFQASQVAGHNVAINIPVQESVVGYPEVEAILAVAATCLPALRVLFRTASPNQSAAPPTYRSTSSQRPLVGEKHMV